MELQFHPSPVGHPFQRPNSDGPATRTGGHSSAASDEGTVEIIPAVSGDTVGWEWMPCPQ
jgi:hypothetical protein